MKIQMRPTTSADLTFVLACEQHPDNAPYIGQWVRSRHQSAIDSKDEAHFIVTKGNDPIGYVILTGLTDPHQGIHLKRVVIIPKGQGYGRQTLQWVKAFAFKTQQVHRLWFDVIASNHRARSLYKSEGFTEEGVLRNSWKTASGYEDMVLLSMLASEYASEAG